MTDEPIHKRSPTTPSTPSVRNGALAKKMKRNENLSPTRRKRPTDVSMEEMTRQNIVRTRELQRMRELVKFLELERKFQA
ncbi:LAME_0A06920g1_1 [Lachancea meyersii CBS 8951]|uniref:LAME_0A06920g1_1 n=1 Tax=Lachancea meyersii CBS 8951 TaxID=1266667 RepID=A0A1G4IQM8_9SACH|nr:LAME_0A06920g1_1 [Lachancea meyersii CBS 8951]